MVKKDLLPVALIVLILVVLGAALIIWRPNVEPLPPQSTPTPTSSIAPTTSPTVSETPAENKNITITSPDPQQEVGLPIVVQGQARVFENTLQVRLRDENGDILVERTVMADSPDVGQFGPYSVELHYQEPQGDTGVVEAFQYSARDGSEVDKVTVPVKFTEFESTEVDIYLSNRKKDPNSNNCEVTYPVTRAIPETVTVGRAALDQLLMGPTNSEVQDGFYSNINQGVKINSLTIENGTATVDFSEELDENVAGSCLVQSIRSQIENTLTQFDSVDEVVITVNGKEDALQP